MRIVVLVLVVGAAGGAPVAVASSGPVTVCGAQAEGVPCVDPLGTADPEPVADAQEPDPTKMPVYDTISGNWGGPFWSPGGSHYNGYEPALGASPSITVGGGQIYTTTVHTSAPYGPGIYAYNDQSPTQLTHVAQRDAMFTGISYYRGEIYVSGVTTQTWAKATGSVIWVYDTNLQLKRTMNVAEVPGVMSGRSDVEGIDVANGEIVARSLVPCIVCDAVTYPDGLLWDETLGLDRLVILDTQTGALRGIIPLGLVMVPVGEEERQLERADERLPMWTTLPKDVAISPELNVVSSGSYSVHRTLPYDAAGVDPVNLATQLGTPTQHGQPLSGLWAATLGDFGCWAPKSGDSNRIQDSTIGSYAPWGMRYLIQIDDCPYNAGTNSGKVSEARLAVDTDTGKVTRQPVRSWTPHDNTSATTRDIAYQAHEPRITWAGKPTETPWQRGSWPLTYFVADGDYFLVGATLEHWFQPARGFQNVVLTAKSNEDPKAPTYTLGSSTASNGTLTVNDDSLPSGTYTLTLTATLDGGRTVTKANPTFRVDHTNPTGTLDGLPEATNNTVDATGTIADAHSGPGSWALKVTGPRTDTACTASAPDPAAGKWGCPWETSNYPEGTYQIQGFLSDSVQTAYGGANTATATPLGNTTVKVDRTPPDLRNFAPALGQWYYQDAVGSTVRITWTQTDNLSGMDTTAVSYNTAPNGDCDGAWNDIGLSSATGDVGISWDTQGVTPGLVCMRAATRDKAGNTRTYLWQLILQDPKAAKPGVNADYHYAGYKFGKWQYGWTSWGMRANIMVPAFSAQFQRFPDGQVQHTALRVAQRAEPETSIEAGVITEGHCREYRIAKGESVQQYRPGDAEQWMIYGSYVFGDQPGQYYERCVDAAPAHSYYEYRTQINPPSGAGGNVTGSMYWSPTDASGGAINEQVIYVHDSGGWPDAENGNYQLNASGGVPSTQAQTETTNYSRRMDGYYFGLLYRNANGSYSSPDADANPPTASDPVNDDDNGGFYTADGPMGHNSGAWGIFCTYGPTHYGVPGEDWPLYGQCTG